MNENKETVIMELQENELTEMISINVICRLCANQNDKLIGIYSEDGINNDLANKMNMYLPIKVNETDDLPLQCCWQCASTVLAWHDLVITSVEADRRLRSYQFVAEKQLHNVQVNFQAEESCHSSEKQNEVEPDHASLNAFCQADNAQNVMEEIKDSKRPIESDFVTSSNDNLSDFANIEPQYLQLNNDLYDIKMEDKNLETKENMELPQICHGADDSLSDNNEKDSPEENQTMYNFGCQYCPMMFLTEEDIISHITETHPDSDFKVDALSQEALQSLKKKRRKNNKIDQDLVNSAKVVVDGRIYYNCKECGKSLHSPYTYVWHMRIHTGERPYVCDLCGKQFRVSQGLVRHLKETHARIKNFACDLCGRMFATRRNVEEHRRIHTNERPYVCDLCGKSFKQKASLFVHNRSHTDTFPFKCTYCTQAFRTKPPLLIHVTKHTGEKPYPCDVCGRCFRIKYELKRHRLIHSDEKPFLCTTCGLSFRQKRYLRNHNKLNHTVQ
ncbi:zinc finger protein 484-like isoform X2 [Anoplophora glabripennis]|nr:zinc finger protein 484-like isoform X2 [Anoplophora glabripennis]